MDAPREGEAPSTDPNAPTVRRPSSEPTVLATPATAASPPAAAAPPERFGRYELRAPLGRGGMGIVYRAFDTQLKREVALKVLRMHAGDEAQQFLRFRREAEAAARLRHPNLVVTYDLGVEGEHHFLTMELVEGGTLARRLESQGGRLPPVEEAQQQGEAAHADVDQLSFGLTGGQHPCPPGSAPCSRSQATVSCSPWRSGVTRYPSSRPALALE